MMSSIVQLKLYTISTEITVSCFCFSTFVHSSKLMSNSLLQRIHNLLYYTSINGMQKWLLLQQQKNSFIDCSISVHFIPMNIDRIFAWIYITLMHCLSNVFKWGKIFRQSMAFQPTYCELKCIACSKRKGNVCFIVNRYAVHRKLIEKLYIALFSMLCFNK